MKITQAIYLEPPRQGVHIVIDSLPAIIKPIRKSLLDRGIAVLADAADAEFPWVNNLAYHLDGDETNLEPGNKIVGGTDDPVIVCLSRRYWRAIHHSYFRPGPVKIPTAKEARRELEDSTVWQNSELADALAA